MAENGFFYRGPSPAAGGPAPAWESLVPLQHADFSWKKMAAPILQQYVESTDGSSVETKESALVWHFRDADPDFGAWQVGEGEGARRGSVGKEPGRRGVDEGMGIWDAVVALVLEVELWVKGSGAGARCARQMGRGETWKAKRSAAM